MFAFYGVLLVIAAAASLSLALGRPELVALWIALGGYIGPQIWDRLKAARTESAAKEAMFWALRAELERLLNPLEAIDQIRRSKGSEAYLHLTFSDLGWELLTRSGYVEALPDELRQRLAQLYAGLASLNEYAEIYNEFREDDRDLARDASRMYGDAITMVLTDAHAALANLEDMLGLTE